MAVAIITLILLGLVLSLTLSPPSDQYPDRTRAETIPTDITKVLPAMDQHPPELHSDLWYEPVPLSGPVNTAGAEDSPFILPDGGTLYFFFTPDVRKPPQEQLFDGVSGLWRSEWNGTSWSEPVRVWLQSPDKLALDGAAFVLGDQLWFASAREGYTGVQLFTATWEEGRWQDWTNAGDLLNQEYQAGEMHITANGTTMYFHSARPGGAGGLDIWTTQWLDGSWSEPVNVAVVNSAENDGYPFVSQDGMELWLTRTYMGTPALFRSLWSNGTWGEPELIVSTFAGEATLDQEGNLYFVHHFYRDGVMIEADIYVAYRK